MRKKASETIVWKEPGDKRVEEAPEKQPKKWKIACLIILGGILAASFCVYAGFAYHYRDRFLQGTFINQVDCSGMTVDEVEKILAEQVEEYSLTLVFRDGSREELTAEQIGYHYVSDGSVQEVMDGQNPWMWITGYFRQTEDSVTAAADYEEEMLRENLYALPELQDEAMTAPADAYIDFQNGSFVIVPEVAGSTLNRETVLAAAEQAVEEARTELDLEGTEGAYSAPAVTQTDENLNSRVQELNGLISSSITYILPEGTQVLDGGTLIDWLSRDEKGNYYRDDAVWNENIARFVAELAAGVDTAGQDRSFSATGLGRITVGGGVYGWKVDQEKEIAQLTQELSACTVTEREPVYSRREVSAENDGLGYSYVEIDLSRQHLWLYKDGQLQVESDIVSGKMTSDRYTPPGIFQMYYKQKDKVLKGEIQEDGKPEYEQPVDFWMPFNGGIGLHDATWNPSFGGDRYIHSGSHGCINLPYDIAEQIYNLIDTEMPIICYYSQPYTLNG
jgi:vancomycin resistance protein YoaR